MVGGGGVEGGGGREKETGVVGGEGGREGMSKWEGKVEGEG